MYKGAHKITVLLQAETSTVVVVIRLFCSSRNRVARRRTFLPLLSQRLYGLCVKEIGVHC